MNITSPEWQTEFVEFKRASNVKDYLFSFCTAAFFSAMKLIFNPFSFKHPLHFTFLARLPYFLILYLPFLIIFPSTSYQIHLWTNWDFWCHSPWNYRTERISEIKLDIIAGWIVFNSCTLKIGTYSSSQRYSKCLLFLFCPAKFT